MKTDLKKYMEERDRQRDAKSTPGPVVTISRQYGCEANKITSKLLAKIAEINEQMIAKSDWSYINKEALEEASSELELPVHTIEHRMSSEHNTVNDLFASFSRHYMVSDKRISEVLTDVMETYIKKGNTIIVGRGGADLANKYKNTVNVSLYAPIEHRMKVIAKSKGITPEEAKVLIEEVDKSRRNWKENFTGKKFDLGIYDATLNTMRLSTEEIVEVIITLMREREILPK